MHQAVPSNRLGLLYSLGVQQPPPQTPNHSDRVGLSSPSSASLATGIGQCTKTPLSVQLNLPHQTFVRDVTFCLIHALRQRPRAPPDLSSSVGLAPSLGPLMTSPLYARSASRGTSATREMGRMPRGSGGAGGRGWGTTYE